jgi:hypothetical protein
MRIRLTAPVILNGHREPGYVFPEGAPNEWSDERCEALLERGLAERIDAAAPVAPIEAIDEALTPPPAPVEAPPVVVEMAAPVVTPRRNRHR